MAADFSSGDSSPSTGSPSVPGVYLQCNGIQSYIYPTFYSADMPIDFTHNPCERIAKVESNIIKPIRIVLRGIVKEKSFSNLEALYDETQNTEIDPGKLCTFGGKDGVYDSLSLESLTVIGDSANYDGIEVEIQLQEVFLDE